MCGKRLFTQREVGVWNELPEGVVEAALIEVLNRELDCSLKRENVHGYGDQAGERDSVKCSLIELVQTQWVKWPLLLHTDSGITL